MLPDIVGDHVALAEVTTEGQEGVDFKPIAIDIDTTGRRLCDKLAVFAPTGHFEQYIMPSMNLNSAARQRHQVRVKRLKGNRVLKAMLTNKVIKSESELAGFQKFIAWLEEQSSRESDIVIIYHEERKFMPLMIVQSLIKFNMLATFSKLVLGFVNTNNIAKSMLSGADRAFLSVRNLSILLTKDKDNKKPGKEFIGNATVRAKLMFNVAVELCGREPRGGNLCDALKPYIESTDAQVIELDKGYMALKRQNSFRPLFIDYFKTTVQRVRAVKFRIVLAENGLDLNILSAIWKDIHIQGLISTLQPISNLSDKEKAELVALLDSYLDPNKIAINPEAKPTSSSRRRRSHNNSVLSQAAVNKKLDAPFRSTASQNTSTPNKENVPSLKNNRNDNSNDSNNENIIENGIESRENTRRIRNTRRIKLSQKKPPQNGPKATEQPLQENKQVSTSKN
ncbi:maternal protein exuperantia-like isoform X2 [Drosophila hydei]|uniref:Maternal protein exuperantia-like isoform X2 n=1 Tax=Drosophila hydei TaxID=7224 RepID=A0A6J1M4E6_DROHY|nr:maternal protein exuperantia-like isoform X2 [Drosophila hydei]